MAHVTADTIQNSFQKGDIRACMAFLGGLSQAI